MSYWKSTPTDQFGRGQNAGLRASSRNFRSIPFQGRGDFSSHLIDEFCRACGGDGVVFRVVAGEAAGFAFGDEGGAGPDELGTGLLAALDEFSGFGLVAFGGGGAGALFLVAIALVLDFRVAVAEVPDQPVTRIGIST